GASIDVDGVRLEGTTPLTAVRIAAGRVAAVIAHENYLPLQEELVIKAGARRKLERKLDADFGTLLVESTPPGAQIFIDDRASGQTTPWSFDHQASGRREVRLERDGFAAAGAIVDVPRGKKARVQLELGALFGSLVVRAPLNTAGGESPDCRAAVTLFR